MKIKRTRFSFYKWWSCKIPRKMTKKLLWMGTQCWLKASKTIFIIRAWSMMFSGHLLLGGHFTWLPLALKIRVLSYGGQSWLISCRVSYLNSLKFVPYRDWTLGILEHIPRYKGSSGISWGLALPHRVRMGMSWSGKGAWATLIKDCQRWILCRGKIRYNLVPLKGNSLIKNFGVNSTSNNFYNSKQNDTQILFHIYFNYYMRINRCASYCSP